MKKILTFLLLLIMTSMAGAQSWVPQYNYGSTQVSGFTQNSVFALPYMDVSGLDTSKWKYEKDFGSNLYKWVVNKVTIDGIAPGKIKLPIYYNPDSQNSGTVDTTKIPYLNKNNTYTGTNIYNNNTYFNFPVTAKKLITDTLIVNFLDSATSFSASLRYDLNNKEVLGFSGNSLILGNGFSSVIPQTTGSYYFGSQANKWKRIFSDSVDAGTIRTNLITLDTAWGSSTNKAGSMWWDNVEGTINAKMFNGSVLQVGQEMYYYGKAIGSIQNGDLVQFAGVQGNHVTFKKAVASEIQANPEYLMGIATNNIANGNFGYVTWFGKINDVYTPNWTTGEMLYFSNTTGQLTDTVPAINQTKIIVACVIKAATGNSENGIMLVRPTEQVNTNTFGKIITDSIVSPTAIRLLNDSVIAQNKLFAPYIAMNTAGNFISRLAIGMTDSTGAFNIVRTDKNLNRSTLTQATDTSSFNFRFTPTGKPLLNIVDNLGTSLFRVDSTGISITDSIHFSNNYSRLWSNSAGTTIYMGKSNVQIELQVGNNLLYTPPIISNGTVRPYYDYTGNLGTYNTRWDTVSAKVGKLNMILLPIDSIGSSKSDTIKTGKATMIVNCDATNNDTVFLANIGISDGFECTVKKIDANATYVVVKPKGSLTVDGATEDKFNTQWVSRTYIYKNKAWYIK